MRRNGNRLPLLVVIACLPLAFCGPVEQEQQDRGVSLAPHADFLTYTLSASQVVVLARDGHGAVLLTNWSRGGSDWRATGMVLNPSQAVLNSLYERASR